MKNKMFILIVILITFLFFCFCEKDPASNDDNTPVKTEIGAYILNQGLYGSGNGSLSYIDLEDNTVYNSIYYAANNEYLGDTPNHMVINDGKLYICLMGENTLKIIEEDGTVNAADKNIAEGFGPAFISKYSNFLFISGMNASKAAVFNITNQTVESSLINVGSYPEGIITENNKVYTANSGWGFGNTVSVINPESRTVTKTITVWENPRFLSSDGSGNLYVLCSGSYGDYTNPDDDTPGKIIKISTSTDTATDTLVIGGHPGKLDILDNNKGYLITESGILEFNPGNMEITNENLIAGSFYCVKVRQSSGDIWIADAKDFTSNGEVRVYSSSGALKNTFEVGINPGEIVFKEN